MGTRFNIPDTIDQQLVDLILDTESMDDNEKQYWFDIHDSMNEQQLDRLKSILETEREKLIALGV